MKAYSEILAEMRLLEFGEESCLASPSSSGSSHNPSALGTSIEGTLGYEKVNYSNVTSVESISIRTSELDLSRKVPSKRLVQGSKQPEFAIMSSNEIRPSISRSGNEASAVNSSYSAGQRIESNRSKLLLSDVLRLDTTKIIPRMVPCAGSIRDPTEFVESIRGFLSSEKIHMVVDKVRGALEEENVELKSRIKQLELAMESDCEVIVTQRSSNISTPSKASSHCSSRSEPDEIFHGASARSSSGGTKWGCGDCGGSCEVTEQRIVDKTISSRGATSGVPESMFCVHCAANRRKNEEVFHSDLRRDGNNNNSNNNNNSDNSRRSSRNSMNLFKEHKSSSNLVREVDLSIKVPSVPTSDLSGSMQAMNCGASSDHLDSDGGSGWRERDGGIAGETVEGSARGSAEGSVGGRGGTQTQRSSRFRNRLQAARDEHHFLADNYSSSFR